MEFLAALLLATPPLMLAIGFLALLPYSRSIVEYQGRILNLSNLSAGFGLSGLLLCVPFGVVFVPALYGLALLAELIALVLQGMVYFQLRGFRGLRLTASTGQSLAIDSLRTFVAIAWVTQMVTIAVPVLFWAWLIYYLSHGGRIG